MITRKPTKPAGLTPAEQKRLVDLLGKLLNQAHHADRETVFEHSWKLLYMLGAQILDQDGEFWVVRSK